MLAMHSGNTDYVSPLKRIRFALGNISYRGGGRIINVAIYPSRHLYVAVEADNKLILKLYIEYLVTIFI